MSEQQPTEAEIRRVIAEFMGWTDVHPEGELVGMYFLYGNRSGNPQLAMVVPDYYRDLNAVHDVEAELETRGLASHHLHELYYRASDGKQGVIDPGGPYEYWEWGEWYIVHATARQRAEAAYRVIKTLEATK